VIRILEGEVLLNDCCVGDSIAKLFNFAYIRAYE